MAQKLLRKVGAKRKVAPKKAVVDAPKRIVLVGTYGPRQLEKRPGYYNYPLYGKDRIDVEAVKCVNELWLFSGAKQPRYFAAECLGVKTREELKEFGYKATGKGHGSGKYLLFKIKKLYAPSRDFAESVTIRTKDFAGQGATQKQLKAYLESPDRKDSLLAKMLPKIVTELPRERLRVCEAAVQLDLELPFESVPVLASDRITTKKAMQMLSLSRHSYDKLISKGIVVRRQDGDDAYFLLSDIENAKKSAEYIAMMNGIVDGRNTLNDLTGKDWIPETKSYLYQKGLGADSSEAQIERMHPAPYSFQDIGHLIRFFTKRGMRVLDPFGGVGSTAKACEIDGRFCTSIELSKKWHELSIKRLEVEVAKGASAKHNFINGDSCEVLQGLEANSVDFVVTSPPYWGILNKQDQKVKRDRVSQNLDTKYSNDRRDLGNMVDYREFLDVIVEKVFLQCARVLKQKKYMAIVVSDFRDKSQFVSFHSDLIVLMNNTEIPGGGVLQLQGTKVLIQNHKSLLPYGYPFAYVENIHHQYILIFKKDS